MTDLFMFAVLCVCSLLKLAHAEYTNCASHKDIEAVRHPKSYVLVKEVTKEVMFDKKCMQPYITTERNIFSYWLLNPPDGHIAQ